jgi:hypothetical protein
MAGAGRFRDIKSAPQDSTTIEVKHGPSQEIVRARWSGQTQAWIRDHDPIRKTLHKVSVWRPIKIGQGRPLPPIDIATVEANSDRLQVQPSALSTTTNPTTNPTILFAKRPRSNR